jgi:hypothetical protein
LIIEKALSKVKKALQRWEAFVARQKFESDEQWLLGVLQDYCSDNPKSPVPVRKGNWDLNISMTIDPTFSYATRRPFSDGLIIRHYHDLKVENAKYGKLRPQSCIE